MRTIKTFLVLVMTTLFLSAASAVAMAQEPAAGAKVAVKAAEVPAKVYWTIDGVDQVFTNYADVMNYVSNAGAGTFSIHKVTVGKIK